MFNFGWRRIRGKKYKLCPTRHTLSEQRKHVNSRQQKADFAEQQTQETNTKQTYGCGGPESSIPTCSKACCEAVGGGAVP